MEHRNNHGFSYTYSAKEQAEIRRIREKYTNKPTAEDKMARLRRLDERVTQKAQAVSLVFGVIGALILGLGMSFLMTDLSNLLGALRSLAYPLGILIGIAGLLLVVLAYPMYHRTVKREREKVAPEILRLTDELMR